MADPFANALNETSFVKEIFSANQRYKKSRLCCCLDICYISERNVTGEIIIEVAQSAYGEYHVPIMCLQRFFRVYMKLFSVV